MSGEASRAWLAGGVTIARAVVDEIDALAVGAYPDEACGFLTGPAERAKTIDRAIPAANLADRYHAVDPETFPRTARTFYIIDARLIQKTFDEGERGARPVKAIYHSHSDVGAYFSAEDQAAAAPDGVLSYPVAYLVVSVRKGVVDDHKLFTFDGRAWNEAAFTIVA